MKRYTCIKPFCVDNYDADGFLIENSSTVIEKGKIYELDESGHTMFGGEIHLDAIDNGSWLEITKEHLKEYFDEMGHKDEKSERKIRRIVPVN